MDMDVYVCVCICACGRRKAFPTPSSVAFPLAWAICVHVAEGRAVITWLIGWSARGATYDEFVTMVASGQSKGRSKNGQEPTILHIQQHTCTDTIGQLRGQTAAFTNVTTQIIEGAISTIVQ